ncbi:MAG: prolipoprotein diacylglyceryl transferase [Clostridia bacterium]|nr:prolipoprotein diacylglyceryl transferase [Clostridia bacterium]
MKSGIAAALCALLLLVLCFAVPDGQILWEAGDALYTGGELPAPSVQFLPYGTGLAVSALLAWAASYVLHRRETALAAALRWFACALALGILLARLLYCAADTAYYNPEWYSRLAALRLWDGGMAMTGALLGILLAGRFAPEGARLAPVAAPLFVAGARLSEAFAQIGHGPSVGFSGILSRRMGFAVRLNVSLIEAVVALIILACILLLPRWAAARKVRLATGSRVCAFLLLYGVTQILMESLRKDRHMIWGFTKAQQILALLLVIGAMLYIARGKRNVRGVLIASILATIPVVILEFALDRADISIWLLYVVYIAILAAFLRYLIGVFVRALPSAE